MPDRPVITPDLKIGAFLEAYPELEEVLIAAAPAFAKLRNPLLRQSVARVTTLRQAARVGVEPRGQAERAEHDRSGAGAADA